MVLRVVLPTARAGVATAAVLALARAAGETAPLLLTALGNLFFSTDLLRPIAALALLSLWAVLTRRFTLARFTAAGEVTMLLWGWALAQWPYIIYPDLTFEASAAPDATLAFVLATAPVGALLLVPSLLFLFAVFKGRNPEASP